VFHIGQKFEFVTIVKSVIDRVFYGLTVTFPSLRKMNHMRIILVNLHCQAVFGSVDYCYGVSLRLSYGFGDLLASIDSVFATTLILCFSQWGSFRRGSIL
jgi:hypothetical protein